MSSKLYNSNGFFSIEYCKSINVPFNIIIGGRGTGKSFSLLSDFFESDSRFMYMRRNENQVSNIANEKYNPFKAVNHIKGYDVSCRYSKSNSSGEFFIKHDKDEKFLGYAGALSTFGKMRGCSLEEVTVMLVDEFNRQIGERYLAEESDLLFNAYETISRNRELAGHSPLRLYLLSNSTTLDSPILIDLGADRIIERMKKNGETIYTNRQDGLHIELLDDSPISQKKRDTALYRLTRNTSYSRHALDNDFSYDDMSFIRSVKMSEYLPIVRVNELFIYRHKSRLEYFVCKTKGNCELEFDGSQVKIYKKTIGMTIHKYSLAGYVFFENFNVKNAFYHIYID